MRAKVNSGRVFGRGLDLLSNIDEATLLKCVRGKYTISPEVTFAMGLVMKESHLQMSL